MSVHRRPESPGSQCSARMLGAVQVGITWLLSLGPIGRDDPPPEWLGLPLITILPLCHQINKGIRMIYQWLVLVA